LDLRADGFPELEVSDATQRLNVNAAGPQAQTPPRPRTTPAQRPHTTTQRPDSAQRHRATAEKKRKEKILIITLCSISAILLILAVIGIISQIKPGAPKDGYIQKNVYVLGIDLGGMTKAEAKAALHKATDNTFSKEDMKVTVLDTQIFLSPKDTGAALNVDAVIDDAYSYGRNGGSSKGSYTVSILPYLSLDTDYIKSELEKLGELYDSTRSNPDVKAQPTERPNLSIEEIDTSTVHQVLTIYMGTAEYDLNLDKLYQQIMDAYNTNLFEVIGSCTEIPPDQPLDLEALFNKYCTEAQDAEEIPGTTEKPEFKPEVYGYGVTKEELRTAIENAKYGETITLELRYIKPAVTEEMLTNGWYKDELSSYPTAVSTDPNWNHNLKLICDLLNGTEIKAGAEFSFNQIIGEPTIEDGYFAINTYVGKSYREVVGAGVSQVASTLYSCVLKADLEVLERHAHSYIPSFVAAGFDAEVYYGQSDFRFRNNTDYPIQINASIDDKNITISLKGTDTKDYTVTTTPGPGKIKEPITVYNIMTENNAGGYKDGDILVQPIVGMDISTYIIRTSKETGEEVKELIATSAYSKLDQVVVKIDTPVTEPPTEPTVPPTEPPTEFPTDGPTDAPTEPPTEEPTEEPTDAPTEPPTEEPTQMPTDAPTEPPTEEPTDAPTEPSTEEPTEEPTEPPVETPTEEPTAEPSEPEVSEPTDGE